MLVSKGHAANRAILNWVLYAATTAMVTSRLEPLQRAMSDFMVPLQLESVMMSTACVSIGGHRNHTCGDLRAELSQTCPWLVQERMTLPLSGYYGWRAGSASLLKEDLSARPHSHLCAQERCPHPSPQACNSRGQQIRVESILGGSGKQILRA